MMCVFGVGEEVADERDGEVLIDRGTCVGDVDVSETCKQ
jgi:hypothetical protein